MQPFFFLRNLNTSHVNVNHTHKEDKMEKLIYLNTSHVNVNLIAAMQQNRISEFKYISC